MSLNSFISKQPVVFRQRPAGGGSRTGNAKVCILYPVVEKAEDAPSKEGFN